MRRDEASRGFWLASALGFPILNTALIYWAGTARQWTSVPWPLAGLLLVELAVLATRLRSRSRRQALWLILLAALAIVAGSTVLVFVAAVPYLYVLCSTSAQPCFN